MDIFRLSRVPEFSSLNLELHAFFPGSAVSIINVDIFVIHVVAVVGGGTISRRSTILLVLLPMLIMLASVIASAIVVVVIVVVSIVRICVHIRVRVHVLRWCGRPRCTAVAAFSVVAVIDVASTTRIIILLFRVF